MNYLKSSDKLRPVITLKDYVDINQINDSDIYFFKKDLVLNLMFAYFDVFNMILDVVSSKESLDVLEKEMTTLLELMRKKYSPLFRNVLFNQENGSVNWGDMFFDRRGRTWRKNHIIKICQFFFRKEVSKILRFIQIKSIRLPDNQLLM